MQQDITRADFIEEVLKFKAENHVKLKQIFSSKNNSLDTTELQYKFFTNKIIHDWLTRDFEDLFFDVNSNPILFSSNRDKLNTDYYELKIYDLIRNNNNLCIAKRSYLDRTKYDNPGDSLNSIDLDMLNIEYQKHDMYIEFISNTETYSPETIDLPTNTKFALLFNLISDDKLKHAFSSICLVENNQIFTNIVIDFSSEASFLSLVKPKFEEIQPDHPITHIDASKILQWDNNDHDCLMYSYNILQAFAKLVIEKPELAYRVYEWGKAAHYEKNIEAEHEIKEFFKNDFCEMLPQYYYHNSEIEADNDKYNKLNKHIIKYLNKYFKFDLDESDLPNDYKLKAFNEIHDYHMHQSWDDLGNQQIENYIAYLEDYVA